VLYYLIQIYRTVQRETELRQDYEQLVLPYRLSLCPRRRSPSVSSPILSSHPVARGDLMLICGPAFFSYGCSVWGSFWMKGLDWPASGEIDVFEGVNLQTTNRVYLDDPIYQLPVDID
jgi:hypothetical protein